MDIAGSLQPYISDLSPTQLAQVSTYLDLLLRWNSKMNLTSVRDLKDIVSRHFGESFFLATQLFPLSFRAERGIPTPAHQLQILDLGSGAGFPAIPLKIYRPDLALTLVEAHHRKAVFLREVLRALNLDAEVKNVRAEDLPPASADLVTLRAVEKFDSILPTAARLLRKEVMDAGRPRPAEPDFVHRPPSTVHSGLALLIGSAQIARAQQLLLNWRFHPGIPIPNSQNRVIQLVEPS